MKRLKEWLGRIHPILRGLIVWLAGLIIATPPNYAIETYLTGSFHPLCRTLISLCVFGIVYAFLHELSSDDDDDEGGKNAHDNQMKPVNNKLWVVRKYA